MICLDHSAFYVV